MKKTIFLAAAMMMLTGCGTNVAGATPSNVGGTKATANTTTATAPANQVNAVTTTPKLTSNKVAPASSGFAVYSSKAVPGEVESLLVKAGKGSNVEVEMYEFTNHALAQALVDAKRRGANVRVIVGATYKGNSTTAHTLKNAGIPVETMNVTDHGYTDIDHVKLFVVNQDLLVGGVNFGAETYRTTDADVLVPGGVKTANALFNYDWRVGATGNYVRADNLQNQDPTIWLYTDNQIEPAVLNVIRSAKSSINLYMFSLDRTSIVDALVSAKRRGILVNVTVDQHYEKRVNARAVAALEGAGIHVTQSPYNSVLHAKVLIIDGKTVVFGSANYTNSGMRYNHEIITVLTSPSVAQGFEKVLS